MLLFRSIRLSLHCEGDHSPTGLLSFTPSWRLSVGKSGEREAGQDMIGSGHSTGAWPRRSSARSSFKARWRERERGGGKW